MGFFSDAASASGWGAYYQGAWTQGRWDPKFIRLYSPSIAWMELYALTVGVLLWSSNFCAKRIVVNCDNKASVAMVNKQTSPYVMSMGLIRLLVHAQLRYHFTLSAQYIKGEDKTVADALSHFQEGHFQELCPHEESAPTPPPPFLWPLSSAIWMQY